MSAPKVILHIGAHKTATTYLQARLTKNANPLRQMQVGYIGLSAFREAQTKAGGLRRAAPRLAMLSRRSLRIQLTNLIRQEVAFGAERIVLSDENIMGNMADLSCSQMFYPNVRARIRAMTDALRDWDLEIAVSTRDYATFLPSVWSHMVMRDGYQPFDPEMTYPLLNHGRGWADVLQDVRSAVPSVPLKFWTYEDLSHSEPAVLEMLLGEGVPSVLEPIRWQALAGLSAAAVEQIERQIQAGESPTPQEIHDTARKFGKSRGYRRYNPLPDAKVRDLSTRYAKDLKRISQLAGIERVGEPELAKAA